MTWDTMLLTYNTQSTESRVYCKLQKKRIMCLIETKSSFSEFKISQRRCCNTILYSVKTWRLTSFIFFYLDKFFLTIQRLCYATMCSHLRWIRTAGYSTSVSSFPHTQIAPANVKKCVWVYTHAHMYLYILLMKWKFWTRQLSPGMTFRKFLTRKKIQN